MRSKSSLSLIVGNQVKSWSVLEQRLVIEPTFSPVNLRTERVARKDFNLSSQAFFGAFKKERLPGLFTRDRGKN